MQTILIFLVVMLVCEKQANSRLGLQCVSGPVKGVPSSILVVLQGLNLDVIHVVHSSTTLSDESDESFRFAFSRLPSWESLRHLCYLHCLLHLSRFFDRV